MKMIRALLRDRRGVTAVEFALTAPFILLCMIGVSQACFAIRAQNKVAFAADSLAKTVAQQTDALALAQFQDLCTQAKLSLRPFDGGALSATIISVTNSSTTNTVQMDWQSNHACNNTGSTVDSGTAIGMAMDKNLVPNSGDSVILVILAYPYATPASFLFTQNFSLSALGYARPRNNSTINISGACANC